MEGEGNNYFTVEDFEGLTYNQSREKALDEAAHVNSELMDNSVTVTAYAADTMAEGQNLQYILREKSDSRVKDEAARFFRYEVTEGMRSLGILNMGEEGHGMTSALVEGESPEEELFRAFFYVDRPQGGYTDKRPETEFDGETVEPERYPNPTDQDTFAEYQMAALDEAQDTDPDNIGNLNQDATFVANDDWMRYKRGNQPLGVDKEIREEVDEFLREMGVPVRPTTGSQG
ncbi:MAG: hypothetical protein ABEK04_01685 [Candidatus Nanohalobium sp.]